MSAVSSRSRLHVAGKLRHLVLFVAGDEPNSRIARANLDRLREPPEAGRWKVDVIDVLEDFEPAVRHNILVTPALLQIHPEPRVLVVGNLSDLAAARAALGIPAARSTSTAGEI
jgi:circadian clock protein KaiB